ncbi:MAG: (2Fe-2S)-binding protein [Actinobacteria bacterium]|nr:(2Fe-2S)-binding protein [Actinomycetota bacterium]
MGFRVNGRSYQATVDFSSRLLDVLRDQLHLTGTKEGCGTGECGACSIFLNGRLVKSCLVFAVQADGAEILTIEGVGSLERLHPIQEAFAEMGAVQCGFCTPGMVLAAKNLLDQNPDPTEREVREAISGNLCRCTGYSKIVAAVLEAAARMRRAVV